MGKWGLFSLVFPPLSDGWKNISREVGRVNVNWRGERKEGETRMRFMNSRTERRKRNKAVRRSEWLGERKCRILEFSVPLHGLWNVEQNVSTAPPADSRQGRAEREGQTSRLNGIFRIVSWWLPLRPSCAVPIFGFFTSLLSPSDCFLLNFHVKHTKFCFSITSKNKRTGRKNVSHFRRI